MFKYDAVGIQKQRLAKENLLELFTAIRLAAEAGDSFLAVDEESVTIIKLEALRILYGFTIDRRSFEQEYVITWANK